jgi:hypothetical protein
VSEVNRKILERSGSHWASIFHVAEKLPRELPATAPGTQKPADDTNVLAALGTARANPAGAEPGGAKPAGVNPLSPAKAARSFAHWHGKHGVALTDHEFANAMRSLQDHKQEPSKIPCEQKLIMGRAKDPMTAEAWELVHPGTPW